MSILIDMSTSLHQMPLLSVSICCIASPPHILTAKSPLTHKSHPAILISKKHIHSVLSMINKKVDEYTIFPSAPITEAILDIRAELPEDVTLESILAVQNSIRGRFPEKKERYSYEAGFQFSQEGVSTTPTQHKIDGYLFESLAEKKIVQARLDGFTFNKLKPYENWESFCREGRELWNLYSRIAQPTKVIRIALRYINRIEIPLPLKNFEEYILTFPQIAPNLPQAVTHFFMQFVISNSESEANAMITLAIEKVTDQKLSLIFDIDVSRAAVYIDNKEKIWSDFEKLRIFKNEIFFKSITDKTKELFK